MSRKTVARRKTGKRRKPQVHGSRPLAVADVETPRLIWLRQQATNSPARPNTAFREMIDRAVRRRRDAEYEPRRESVGRAAPKIRPTDDQWRAHLEKYPVDPAHHPERSGAWRSGKIWTDYGSVISKHAVNSRLRKTRSPKS